MDLPKLQDLDMANKRVLLRADLDYDPADTENLRYKTLLPTLELIKAKGGSIILIGHRGRPEGKPDESLSLKPFEKVFEQWGAKVEENLRFNSSEEANSHDFAVELSKKGDVYVNEAFGASHREHASIVGLAPLLPHAVGLHFEEEVEKLGRVIVNPEHPVLLIISGIKDDKLAYLPVFQTFADYILIGGRMPDYIHDSSALRHDNKIIVASLMPDKEDITINSIEKFEAVIKEAKTIVLSGPLGKYEEEGHRQGTQRIFNAVAGANAFKVAGGGDSISAINLLGLGDKFDWISTGGGAMLEFLAKGTLPGIEAMK